MDGVEVARLRDDLADFAEDVFVVDPGPGVSYLQGVMLEGRRKSIQPMAVRLAGVHDQVLNHL